MCKPPALVAIYSHPRRNAAEFLKCSGNVAVQDERMVENTVRSERIFRQTQLAGYAVIWCRPEGRRCRRQSQRLPPDI